MEHKNTRELRSKTQSNYHVIRRRDFDKLQDIMRLMPSFESTFDKTESFTDEYFETENNFLKEMGVTVRSRNFKDKKIISVKYSDDLLSEQDSMHQQDIHEHQIKADDDIKNEENLLFIEDKLNIIFSNKLQIDILRKLRDMRPIYKIKTKRKIFNIVHNSGFKGEVHFDKVTYLNNIKNIKNKDYILEIHMKSVYTDLNKKLMDDFISNIRRKLTLIPMKGSKYDMAQLMTRFKK